MPFRTHNFSLRLTDQEIASYEELAKESGVSVSEWVRGVLNENVQHKANIVALAEHYRTRENMKGCMVREIKEEDKK